MKRQTTTTSETSSQVIAWLIIAASLLGMLHELWRLFFRANVKPDRAPEPEPFNPPDEMPSIESLIYIILVLLLLGLAVVMLFVK